MVDLLVELLLATVLVSLPQLVRYPMEVFSGGIYTRAPDDGKSLPRPYPVDFNLRGFLLRVPFRPLLGKWYIHCMALPSIGTESVFRQDLLL